MTIISEIYNNLDDYLLLSDFELSTDGIFILIDENMIINPSENKILCIRTIKCIMTDNPDFSFAIE
jgi:hypothetical protein